jgi:hypothetical protein
MRFNEEVQWADEDYQLGVLTACRDAGSEALARALDLIVLPRHQPADRRRAVRFAGQGDIDTTNTSRS